MILLILIIIIIIIIIVSIIMQRKFSSDQYNSHLRKLSYQLTVLNSLASTLMPLFFPFDQDKKAQKTPLQILASQLSSSLMYLIFLFD